MKKFSYCFQSGYGYGVYTFKQERDYELDVEYKSVEDCPEDLPRLPHGWGAYHLTEWVKNCSGPMPDDLKHYLRELKSIGFDLKL